MASSTTRRVPDATTPRRLRTRLTVASLTPARAATSLIPTLTMAPYRLSGPGPGANIPGEPLSVGPARDATGRSARRADPCAHRDRHTSTVTVVLGSCQKLSHSRHDRSPGQLPLDAGTHGCGRDPG